MHQINYTNTRCNCNAPIQHNGLMGIFGGLINLTTSTIYGSARVVRTIVEGSVWHGLCNSCAPYNDRCGCRSVRHCYCVECVPKTHTSCCR